MQQLDLPYQLTTRRQAAIFDEFWEFTTAKTWTTAATSVGGESNAISASALGGQIVLTTGGTQGNQDGIYSTVKGFKSASKQNMLFEMVMGYTDAHVHDAGFFFGFSDVLNGTTSSSPLTANAAALKSSMTAFGFYALSADTNWSCVSQATTTQTTNKSSTTRDDTASTQHVFRIEVFMISTTQCDVVFKIDDKQCIDNSSGLPIKHTVTFNTTAMYAGVTCVAGGANSQTPAVDYLYAGQLQRYNMQ